MVSVFLQYFGTNDLRFQTWLIIPSFLAYFNIGKARDDFGNEIEFDDSFIEFGLVVWVHIPMANIDFLLT